MTSAPPTLEGFRLLFRRTTIPAAELAWRWAFGGTFWFLSGILLVEYASSLTVDSGTRLLLRSGQPILVWRALRHMFSGSALRFTASLLIVFVALLIFWTLAASLGRLTTLAALGEEFQLAHESSEPRLTTLRSLLALNFLRAAALVAAVVASAGSLLLASSIWVQTRASLPDSGRLWFASLCLVWSAWAVVNWFLSTASVFVVSMRKPALRALASLVQWCHEQLGEIVVIGVWFGLAHLVSFILACFVGLATLGVLTRFGVRPVVLVESLIALAYFATADFIYTGRLAAYMALIGGPGVAYAVKGKVPRGSIEGQIDRSELILSDVPV